MPPAEADVAIIGGGIGGLWLAYELAKRRISVTLIDQNPVAGYASTGNQGVLHSGALYATTQSPVAVQCAGGRRELEDFCHLHAPRAISPVRCVYVSTNPDWIDRYVLASQGLPSESLLTAVPFVSVARDIDLLRGTRYIAAATGHDVVIEPDLLLEGLLREEIALGVRVLPSRDPLDWLKIRPTPEGWLIEGNLAGRSELHARALVLACGTLVPSMLSLMGLPDRASDYSIKKSLMVVIHGRDFGRNLILDPPDPDADVESDRGGEGINLTPFSDEDGQPGGLIASRFLSDSDATADDHSWKSPEMLDDADSLLGALGLFPALKDKPRSSGFPTLRYCCQKLGRSTQPSGRAHIIQDLTGQVGAVGSPLYVFYPGKFTTSPSASRELADMVEPLVSKTSPTASSVRHLSTEPIRVTQRQTRKQSHARLAFSPRSGWRFDEFTP